MKRGIIMVHAVKILPEYFNKIIDDKKSYEIRKNDRNYKAGDCLALNEYDDGEYTGLFTLAEIVSVDTYSQYLDEDYVVLQLRPLLISGHINSYQSYISPERAEKKNKGR